MQTIIANSLEQLRFHGREHVNKRDALRARKITNHVICANDVVWVRTAPYGCSRHLRWKGRQKDEGDTSLSRPSNIRAEAITQGIKAHAAVDVIRALHEKQRVKAIGVQTVDQSLL